MELRSPGGTAGACSADFEHVQRAVLPSVASASDTTVNLSEDGSETGNGIEIEALYIDAKGNHHTDLQVVGVIYADTGGEPSTLLAKSRPVLVEKDASRAFVRLPFAQPVPITDQAAVWIGEQAGVAVGGVKPVPGGPNSLVCFGEPASSRNQPLRYMPWPFSSGPKNDFGPSRNVTTSTQSLSVFGVIASSDSSATQPRS